MEDDNLTVMMKVGNVTDLVPAHPFNLRKRPSNKFVVVVTNKFVVVVT